MGGSGELSNELQFSIMVIVSTWSHKKSKPITLKTIVDRVGKEEVSKDTIKSSVRALVKKGYLRKSAVRSGQASYVQLRSIEISSSC